MLRALLMVTALGLLLPAYAGAQEAISIALLPTDTPNPDHLDIGQQLKKAMADAITEVPDFVASDAITSTYAEVEALAGCVAPDPVCLSQVAAMSAAPPDRMAWARLERKEGAWLLHIRMLDFGDQRYVVDRQWTMPGGAERIEELVTLAGGAIRGNAPEAAPTARLIVDSDPPGADISLDGRMLGTTPVTQQVTRGRHLIELSLPGRRTVRKEIDVGVGEVRELIKLPIKPKVVPPSAAPVAEAPDWPFWVGVGSGALAGVSAIVATVAYAQGSALADENEALNARKDRGEIEGAAYDAEFDDIQSRHGSMKTLHLASTLTAAVAGGAAVYFLVFHEDEGPKVVPTVTPEGAGATLTVSF